MKAFLMRKYPLWFFGRKNPFFFISLVRVGMNILDRAISDFITFTLLLLLAVLPHDLLILYPPNENSEFFSSVEFEPVSGG